MPEEVRVRERKSVKHGKTYEYRFEVAPIGGERKWCSKGGFAVFIIVDALIATEMESIAQIKTHPPA